MRSLHAVERLGCFLTRKCTALDDYRDELDKVASTSARAEEVPRLCGGALIPFSRLYDLVQDARNDALHQGAFARHLTTHAIDLALILEDALAKYRRTARFRLHGPKSTFCRTLAAHRTYSATDVGEFVFVLTRAPGRELGPPFGSRGCHLPSRRQQPRT